MADRLRVVEFSAGGRPTTLLDLNDGSQMALVRGTFAVAAPKEQVQMSQSARRFDGARAASSYHENGSISAEWYIRGASMDASEQLFEQAVALLLGTKPGRYVEWRPEGATRSTYFELRGPGEWDPMYQWIEVQQTKTLHVKITAPVAPLAEGDRMAIVDDFAIDTLSDYTFVQGAGTLSWSSANSGILLPTTTGWKLFGHTSRGHSYQDAQITLHFKTGASVSNFDLRLAGRVIGTPGAGSELLARIDATSNLLQVVKRVSGVSATLATIAHTLTTNTEYWLVLRMEGLLVTADLWDTPPFPTGTPTKTVSSTLAGGDATLFGGVASPAYVDFRTMVGTDHELRTFSVEPFVYRNRTLPAKVDLGGSIPGTAPALAELKVAHFGGSAVPIAGVFALDKTPAAGATTAPFDILEAEAGTLTNFSSAADAGSRGGNRAAVNMASFTTASLYHTVDPARLDPDAFQADNVNVEVWARVLVPSTALLPRVVLAADPVSGTTVGLPQYSEFGSAGRSVPVPSSGSRWEFLRLGILPMSQLSTARIRLAFSWLGGSSGTLAVDYLMLVPARARASTPTGKANDASYPDLFLTSSAQIRTFRADLSSTFGEPNAAAFGASGLLGQPLRLPPGNATLIAKLSSVVPDNPAPGTDDEQLAHTATLQVSPIPRYFLFRA